MVALFYWWLESEKRALRLFRDRRWRSFMWSDAFDDVELKIFQDFCYQRRDTYRFCGREFGNKRR
jgi:hypothetical protein